MSTCSFDSEKVKQIQTAVPNHRAAVKIYLLADKKGGDIDANIDSITKYILKKRKEQPRSEKEAQALLVELSRNGFLQHNGKTGNDSFYKTNNIDELAYFMLENKKNFLYIRYGVIDPDVEYQAKPYLYLSTKKTKSFIEELKNYQDPHPETKVDMDLEFDTLGSNLLGKTLVTLSDKINMIQQGQVVNTIAERIAREVLSMYHRGDKLNAEAVELIFNSYKKLLNDNIVRSKELQAKAIEEGNEKHIEHFKVHIPHVQEYIDNFENLKGVVLTTLKKRSGLKITGGLVASDLKEKVDENQSNIEDNSGTQLEDGARERNQWSDDFSITLDSKSTLSTRLKLFLSFIKSDRKHYLFNEMTYEKFDQVYNTMSQILAGEEPI